MQLFSEYQPTVFDSKGSFLPDQQHWFVFPCGLNRDSGPLEVSNFESGLRKMGGESDTVEIHRFGHWACGWFEIIIIDPESKQAIIAKELESAFMDYPVIDEENYSEKENAYVNEVWNDCFNLHEKIELCAKYGISIFSARYNYAPQDDNGDLYEYLRSP